jgi:hypothetical protein
VGQPTVNDYTKSYGAILFIHRYRHTPIAEVEGISVPTAYQTSIILEKKITQKLAAPYSTCIDNVYSPDSFDSDLYRRTVKMTVMYEQGYCLQLCYQMEIISRCNCSDSQSPGYGLAKQECKTLHELDCMFEALKQLSTSNSTASCFDKCKIYEYRFKYSIQDYL